MLCDWAGGLSGDLAPLLKKANNCIDIITLRKSLRKAKQVANLSGPFIQARDKKSKPRRFQPHSRDRLPFSFFIEILAFKSCMCVFVCGVFFFSFFFLNRPYRINCCFHPQTKQYLFNNDCCHGYSKQGAQHLCLWTNTSSYQSNLTLTRWNNQQIS